MSFQGWIIDNPAENLSMEALAQRLAMNPRNLPGLDSYQWTGKRAQSLIEQMGLFSLVCLMAHR